MNFIAGLLLVFVRDEQRAFWLLCAIIEGKQVVIKKVEEETVVVFYINSVFFFF